MKNPTNLHLMQDAEQRRAMIKTYYRAGARKGAWFGFIMSTFLYLLVTVIYIIMMKG